MKKNIGENLFSILSWILLIKRIINVLLDLYTLVKKTIKDSIFYNKMISFIKVYLVNKVVKGVLRYIGYDK